MTNTSLLTEDQTRNQLLHNIGKAIEAANVGGHSAGQISQHIDKIFGSWKLEEKLYQPDADLLRRLDEYELWLNGKRSEDPGQLMEEIALLAMRCLQGHDYIDSYASYASQLDLTISGSTPFWSSLMTFLHISEKSRTILIEAKNLKSKLESKHFSRLASIITSQFQQTCELGIFFSKTDATGFEKTRSLSDSRATQVLFHARTEKFIVVVTHSDFAQLRIPGGLPKLLQEKIKDVEAATDISIDNNLSVKQKKAPPHLAQYLS